MGRVTATASVENRDRGALARGARGARAAVVAEFTQNLGPNVLRITRYQAPHKTRRLERGLRFRVKGAGADGAEMRIESTAVSDRGFPYPRVTRFGRGPVVPRRKKALAFKVGGKTIVRRRVRGYHPVRDWVSTAYLKSRPELERASFRIGARIQAFIGS